MCSRSDVDCGGSCPGCGEDESCGGGGDCGSGLCLEGACRSPYPTAQPSPLPTQSPTVTPCPWLAVPDPPALASVKFSSTGGQLTLEWDSPTDRGGLGGVSFECDELLTFPLVSAATCKWTTSETLTVDLDYRATCVPGDNVTVAAGILKPYCAHSDCSCWPLANASSAVLAVPDEALTPVAIFQGANKIGLCSDVDLDVSTSVGSGGRNWLTTTWLVNGSLPAQNLTALREYAAAWSVDAASELFVPNSYLQAGQTYTFAVLLQNFLGFASTSAPYTVAVAAGSLPNVLITAGTSYVVPPALRIPLSHLPKTTQSFRASVSHVHSHHDLLLSRS